MMFDTQCPLCGTEAQTDDPKPFGIEFEMERIECKVCKTYDITDEAKADIAGNPTEQRTLSAFTREGWTQGNIPEIIYDPVSHTTTVAPL